MAKAVSKGRCRLCGGEYSKSGMSTHLRTCLPRKEPATTPAGGKARAGLFLHLVVSGRYDPAYWMHLEAPADATLVHLDEFLRVTWLECCGHLSAFTIGGVSYSSSSDLDWEIDDRSMNVKLGKVLVVGDEFGHEYDFGSTTYLNLRTVSERKGPTRNRDIEILAQNEPPTIPCDECGQEAVQVCSECMWSGRGWLCDRCSKTHTCGEEMLLPVVNSPRVGVCAYGG